MMTELKPLLTFAGAREHDPAVDAWLDDDFNELYGIARHWFQKIRACGSDIRELIHDGCATACVGNAAFAYVGVHKTHVNVGFFLGAFLDDPEGLLEGSGKRMRHVKIRPGQGLNEKAMQVLIEAGYRLVRANL